MVSSRAASSAEEDPFLAQSQSIPLTARERQEGYDIDLVHSQPRGGPSPAPLPLSDPGSQPINPSDLAYFGHSGQPGAYDNPEQHQQHPPFAPDEKYPARTRGEDERRPRRQWYLRPTALVALIGLVVLVVALAVGLGVGLSKKHNSSKSSAGGTSSGDGAGASSSTTSRNRSSGTVIPSTVELSSSRGTTARPSAATTESVSFGVVSTSDAAPQNPSAGTAQQTTGAAAEAPTLTVASSVTMRASTGNLPIPASQETTITTAGSTIVVESVGTTRQRRSRRT